MTHWWYKLRLWVWNCASGLPSWHLHRHKQAQKGKPDVSSQTNVWYIFPPEWMCFTFNLENSSHKVQLRFCTGLTAERGVVGMLFTCGNRTSVGVLQGQWHKYSLCCFQLQLIQHCLSKLVLTSKVSACTLEDAIWVLIVLALHVLILKNTTEIICNFQRIVQYSFFFVSHSYQHFKVLVSDLQN